MKMDLYLMRHGIATERSARNIARDADRRLTASGKEKMRRIAKAMKRIDINVECILSSPFLRATETVEIVARVLGIRTVKLTPLLKPDGSAGALLGGLSKQSTTFRSLLLVGHEPLLTDTASLLISRKTGLPLHLRKGGLLKLCVTSGFHPGSATLEWLLSPRWMINRQ